MMSLSICRTCAVEHAEPVGTCAICADERQWVPAEGQVWTTLDELAGAGHRVDVAELEPDLLGLATEPAVGIGQQAKVIRTPEGCVLWDPTGFVDDAAVERVRAFAGAAGVVAVVPSHPHMFGVQVEWSRRLGDAAIYVAAADAEWIARPDPAIRTWSDDVQLAPGVTLARTGGHFPGSAVLHWAAGAGGKGVLLAGDTIFPNPDRTSVSFLRSYPNRIPLSGAVVDRVTRRVEQFAFDRMYGNFRNVIDADARAVVRRSADRHAAWVRGDYDHLT